MRVSILSSRRTFRGLWFVPLLALAVFGAPRGLWAQQPAAASAANNTQATGSQQNAAEPQKSQESQDEAFLHAPVVKSMARMLNLPLDTTVHLLFIINFAIIFFAIAIPLGRMMPKILRQRTITVRHNLDEARKATAEAQARLCAVETKLAGLGQEIEKFRAQAEEDSRTDEKRIKASIEEESVRIVAAAEQEIASAAAQARRSLRDFAAGLAVEQAARQLHLTPEADRAVIAEFVAGVAGEGGKH